MSMTIEQISAFKAEYLLSRGDSMHTYSIERGHLDDFICALSRRAEAVGEAKKLLEKAGYTVVAKRGFGSELSDGTHQQRIYGDVTVGEHSHGISPDAALWQHYMSTR
jgi:hypothetical protein